MTNRIQYTFESLKQRREKAFIAYIMAGDPSMEQTRVYARSLIRGGADIIELGMPFSDPIADGPIIQKAAQRALRAKTNIAKILPLVRDLRSASDVPIILMGYINPVLKYGVQRFFRDAARAGVDGVILPDLPLEEAGIVKEAADRSGIDVILLAAPTSDRKRLLELSRHTQGFLYYISMTGVTGSSRKIGARVFADIRWIRRHTDKPVAVGFGIATPEQAHAIASRADGIVVGSALVDLIETRKSVPDKLAELSRRLKSAASRR